MSGFGQYDFGLYGFGSGPIDVEAVNGLVSGLGISSAAPLFVTSDAAQNISFKSAPFFAIKRSPRRRKIKLVSIKNISIKSIYINLILSRKQTKLLPTKVLVINEDELDPVQIRRLRDSFSINYHVS